MHIRTLPKDAFALLARAYTRSKTRVIIAGVLLFALLGFGIYALLPKGASPEEMALSAIRSVELKSAAALSTNSEDLAVVGIIQSESEATVRTESSGQITGVYRTLGDSVLAGTVIAEMENGSQRASVLSAQGGLQAAEANLSKVKAGARPEQVAILESATVSSRTGSVNALLSAYSAIDDAVHHSADLMFSNADTPAPTFNLTVADSQLPINISNQRVALNTILKRESTHSLSNTETSASLHVEIAKTQEEVRATRNFFDDLIAALSKSVPTPSISASDIAAFKTSASASRSSLSASLAALSAADNSLTSADQNLALGVKGGTEQDVALASAGVTQAQGGVASARASLEKTIIRAPISGTINQISLKRGNFESAGSPVVTIANNGSLEAICYITENDATRVVVGEKVSIDEDTEGVITRIAPALDPISKKIEIRVAINNSRNLTNGQSVIVQFGGKKTSTTALKEIIIPLSAIKIEVDGTSVFTVDENSMLVAQSITLGTIMGDRVIVTSGLTGTDIIVTDARGLKAGMKVNVK